MQKSSSSKNNKNLVIYMSNMNIPDEENTKEQIRKCYETYLLSQIILEDILEYDYDYKIHNNMLINKVYYS